VVYIKGMSNFNIILSKLKNYQSYKICIIKGPRIFLFLSHLSIHKKIEYLLPKLTTEVERREWDSNLEAVIRGLYF
jgi:hypothetical protein